MKHLLNILILGSMLSACSKQPVNTSVEDTELTAGKDSAGIVACFNKQKECWNKHDIDCYTSWYYPSEKAEIISKRGVTSSQDSIAKVYKKAFPEDKMGHLDFNLKSIRRLSGKFYYVVGEYILSYENTDTTRSGWFSILMEKKDNTWYMVSDHSS